MSDDDNQQKGRFAELAMELMGAQFAQKMLEEVWGSATPEVKTQLSDKILKQLMTKDISSWHMENVLGKEVNEFLESEGGKALVAKKAQELVDKAASSWSGRYQLEKDLEYKMGGIAQQASHEAVKSVEEHLKQEWGKVAAMLLEAVKNQGGGQ